MSAHIASWPVTVTWGDCDPAGIIYYPTYYRWMDSATWALFAQAGYPAQRYRSEHLSMPLVDAQCSFLSSPTFGDVCVVRSQIGRWGGKSFTVLHEVLRADAGGATQVLARGSETRVWCRYEAGPGTPLRSQPIPADLRVRLGEPDAPVPASSAGPAPA